MASGDQNVRRAGVVVVVPTTDQPIIIKKLAWSARVPVSRVVLATESSEVCEPWSTQYANLLRPGEPLRHILGLPDGGSYRLAASGAIDQGKSWMVPTMAAQCGLAQGEAITHKIAEAKLLVWGTGAIDVSVADTAAEARVTAQEYHLTTKIDRSRHLFAEAEHAATPVLALVPHGDEAERAAGILAKILAGQPHHIAIVSSLADILGPIELYLRSGSFEPPVAPPQPTSPVSASMALEPFVPPAPKAEPAPATPPPAAAAPEPTSQPAAAFEPATSRRSVLGEQAAPASSSLRVPLVAVAAVVIAGLAGAAYVLMRPSAQVSATDGSASAPRTATAPATPQPGATTQPNVPAQPQPPAATQASAVAGPSLARLLTLAPPAGSTCEAQVYELRPRYTEAAIEVPDGAATIEIEGQEICGFAIDPLGATKARFQSGTGPAVVASKSNTRRIIFNPTAMRGGISALPVIEIEEPKAAKIEIKRR